MKKIFRVLLFAFLIGGWALSALSLHVIRTPRNVIIVPKNRLHYQQTYIDTRTWTPEDVQNHEALVERLIAAGKTTDADAVAYLTAPAVSGETTGTPPTIAPATKPSAVSTIEEPEVPTTRSILFD